ncbi:hypothetical protein SMGD1_0074 [Sulfurimonas gotlandica GD1]|uniref:Periplasmic protein n=1 Tax=Sulfurimonas gotlandica (strain DSM 19862 / JCM 16533 / GD1) TaxID=929558 RepID=B6BLE6_SULGG|nr:DUF6488 family protein [Sulfurimonas gotlandica]EDZ62005.1 conserved hypothetical protein [Sulfurimonas gotlandica GD1]EHP28601.1 hypothetical protein SMGD1_0074 [Sulfurimonas gotlandica GD1]
MKTLIKATAVTLALSFTTLYAGSGHSHDGEHGHSHAQAKVSQSVVKKQANQGLTRLIQSGKVEKSWSNIPIKDMNKKQFHHNMEWVVSYENKKITNKTEQTLYIFVSLTGEITGANYTGK